MVTPRKKDILEHARRIEMSDIVRGGLPALTPEDYELKESGAFQKARIQLMRKPATEAFMQQRKYLDEMADEMGLRVMSRKDIRHLERLAKKKKVRVEPNGNSIMYIAYSMIGGKVGVPKPKPKPKKRQRLHTTRSGKTMRVLRNKVDGKKVVSFPDHIWKVREPRRRGRAKR